MTKKARETDNRAIRTERKLSTTTIIKDRKTTFNFRNQRWAEKLRKLTIKLIEDLCS